MNVEAVRARYSSLQKGFAFFDFAAGRVDPLAPIEADDPTTLMNDGKALDWAICGVGVMPADRRMQEVMDAQDGLYTLVVKAPDGTLSARYWSEAAKERKDPAGILYFWKGERPRHPNAPQLEGTGEITVEGADRASGYWTTRSDRDPGLNARTAGVYLRADPSDLQMLEVGSEEERAQLIAKRLREWKAAANAF